MDKRPAINFHALKWCANGSCLECHRTSSELMHTSDWIWFCCLEINELDRLMWYRILCSLRFVKAFYSLSSIFVAIYIRPIYPMNLSNPSSSSTTKKRFAINVFIKKKKKKTTHFMHHLFATVCFRAGQQKKRLNRLMMFLFINALSMVFVTVHRNNDVHWHVIDNTQN